MYTSCRLKYTLSISDFVYLTARNHCSVWRLKKLTATEFLCGLRSATLEYTVIQNFCPPAALRAAHSAGISVTRGGHFEVIAPEGRHVAPIGMKFDVEESTHPRQISPQSVQGWGFAAPNTENFTKFRNINTPQGHIHWAIFTRFSSFIGSCMFNQVLKFGRIRSISFGVLWV